MKNAQPDYGNLLAHVASAIGMLKGHGHEKNAATQGLQYVLDELLKLYEASRTCLPTNPTADAHKEISLLTCANVLINSLEYAQTQEWRDAELMRCWPYYSDAAKAVLEAAGVNYVE